MGRARPCDNCRRRKTRCFQNSEGSCQYCSRSGSKCTFNGKPALENMPSKLKVAPLGKEGPLRYDELGRSYIPEDCDTAVFFGPSADQDPFLVEHYEKDADGTHRTLGQGLKVVKSDSATPICFSCVKKPDSTLNSTAMDKLIETHKAKVFATVEPYKERLLALFFRFIDWSFPAVDRLSFYDAYYHHPDNLHTGLLSAMLASSCIYWKYDTQLCVKVIPPNLAQDLWHLCGLIVDREMTHPTLPTLECLLLTLQKRLPRDDTCEHFALATQLGKVVAVVYSLGLHVDCSNWDISDHEKMVRKRLWWCAYVVDKWTAASLGRPSLFHKHSANVAPFASDFPQEQLFLHVCEVTYILDSVLTQIYPVELRYNPTFDISNPEFLSRVDHHLKMLDQWEMSLPEEFKDMSAIGEGEDFCRNGILHLNRLCVRTLLLRVYLNPKLMTHHNYFQYRQMAHEHISAIIKFTCDITHSHLHAFWLSSCCLGFSLLAHFVFYYYVQSPDHEQAEISDSIRKWLWALRVLANTWQEGTGLATLRMDSVFYMGKTNVRINIPQTIPLNMGPVMQFEEEELLNKEFIPYEQQNIKFEQAEYMHPHVNLTDSLSMEDLVHDDLKELLMESYDPSIFENYPTSFI